MNAIVQPTTFDLGVINVVEYLDAMLPQLSLEYVHLQDKRDILNAIGINPAHWSNMVNHYRHVSAKAAKQAEIVSLLKQQFRIDPQYIWNYGTYTRMFLQPIVSGDKKIAGMGHSSRELKRTISILYDEIANYKVTILELKKELQYWKSLAEMQGSAMHHLSIVAEPAVEYSAKNPAKAKSSKPSKPRQ